MVWMEARWMELMETIQPTVIASTLFVNGKPVLNATRAALIDGTMAALRASLSPNNNNKDSIPFISLPDGRSTFELMKLAGPIF